MHAFVANKREELAAICRSRGIRRVELFGSAARNDFDQTRSDIDLLVDFGDVPTVAGMSAYFELKDALERLFERNVDLVEIGSVQNPYVQAQLARDKQLLYAQ